jgi:hypothetical protein
MIKMHGNIDVNSEASLMQALQRKDAAKLPFCSHALSNT